jgi:hypothetical protein
MCYTLVVSGKQNNNKNRRDEMIYNVQYSRMQGDKIAVSDWKEYIVKVEAENSKEAIGIINKRNQDSGCWMILDCWKD